MSTQRKHAYSPSFRGTRVRAAGDIFPYMIVLVGTFTDGFKYHVMGQGFIVGELACNTYKQAHGCAVRLLNDYSW